VRHTTPGYSGGETLGGADVALPDASILNFWQWAYSDLADNVNRGVFAEWMVAKLLGLSYTECRPPWQAWDITSPEGVRIEVKASAYVHSWTTAGSTTSQAAKPTRIEFTNLCTRAYVDEAQTKLAAEPTYNADLYVFCMQTNPDPQTWDALDLSQWEFYLVPKATLEAHGCKSMSLNRVCQLCGSSLTAAEFRKAALQMIAQAETPETTIPREK
jgi:hypothetical protein